MEYGFIFQLQYFCFSAKTCSEQAILNPTNGDKVCNLTGSVLTCYFTCNNGYSFYQTDASTYTTQCFNDNPFTTFVPDCVRGLYPFTSDHSASLSSFLSQYHYWTWITKWYLSYALIRVTSPGQPHQAQANHMIHFVSSQVKFTVLLALMSS